MATALDLERAVLALVDQHRLENAPTGVVYGFGKASTVDYTVRDMLANSRRLDVKISEIHGIDIDDGGRTTNVIRELVETAARVLNGIRSSQFMRLLADTTCSRRAIVKEHMDACVDNYRRDHP